jgi:acetyl-CoA carboxylase beta subunit
VLNLDWISIGTGAMAAALIFALMHNKNDEEFEEELEEDSLTINDTSGRHATMACQTCRKLKKHKEIEPNLWQCVKCKRHTDLRAS